MFQGVLPLPRLPAPPPRQKLHCVVIGNLLPLHVPGSLQKPLPPCWTGRSPFLTGEGPTLRVSGSFPGSQLVL